LPTEIKLMIFEYLQYDDVISLGTVCVHFYNILNSDTFLEISIRTGSK